MKRNKAGYRPGLIILFLLVFTPSLSAGEIRLAILPFDNTSLNSEYDWLGMGIPETLSMSLGGVHNLRLVERLHLDTLMEEYKLILSGMVSDSSAVDLGELEGAELILLGSFQILEDVVLITIRFIDSETGIVTDDQGLSVRGSLDSIFDLYDILSRQIIEKLNVTLTPAESRRMEDPLSLTDSLTAYEFYIRGIGEFRKGTEGGFMLAYDFFLKALEEDPEFGLAYASIALTLEKISFLRARSGREYGSYSDLVPEYYGRAVEFGREGAEIYRTLASILFLRGNQIQGLRQIEKSIYINPMDAETWLIWWQIKDGNDPDHPYLKKALEIDPDGVDVQIALGNALLRKNRTAEALYHLTRAYDLNPGNIQALYGLAELYEYRGYYTEALANYRAIVDLAPRETAGVIELSRLYYQTGQFDECIREAMRFIALEPGTVPVHFYLFLSYFSTGMFEKAESELQNILSLNPKSGFFYSPMDELRYLEDDPEYGGKAHEYRLRLGEIREELGRQERESR